MSDFGAASFVFHLEQGEKAMKTKTIIPLITLAIGVVWIVYGFSHHGFWHPTKGPVAGFVPILIAGTLVVISIVGVIRSFKEADEPDRLENWTIVLAAGAVFSLTFLFGFIVSLMAFVFVWLKIYEKASWKHTIIVSIFAFAFVYGAFVVWLKISFPKGLIIDAILG